MNFELGPAGEAAMRLVFTEVPQPALTKALIEIENQARQHFGSTLTDSVIGYTTLTLFLLGIDPGKRPHRGMAQGASRSHRFGGPLGP